MNLPTNIQDLITKHNRPGPRYTSYPTAPHFSESTDMVQLRDACVKGEGPVSLYLHIPFCKSNCWFCGCNTIITTRNSWADEYLDLLEQEIALIHAHIDTAREVTQIHLGGGTPNFLKPEQIDRLFALLRSGFAIANSCELSVEMAPNYLTQAHVDAFQRAGLSRASFGIQDVQPDVQRAINRVQPMENNVRAIEMLRGAGVKSINIDLVYGLPLQTVASYQNTLREVLKLGPDRLAVFNYAHVPHLKPFQKRLEQHRMPAPEEKIQLLLTIIEHLSNAGYGYIGMDHFAKPEDELHAAQREHRLHRNFQGYTIQEEKEVIALGISSISETPKSYRQNHKDFESYAKSIAAEQWPIARGILLSDTDVLHRSIIQSIMCNLRLEAASFPSGQASQVQALMDHTRSRLQEFEQDGLLRLGSTGFEVTETGRLFLRNIAMEFDAYLNIGDARFSRTV
ncbi:MAG: oxygen-independent coproporphyrinogen III oxidase [Puniceicoccaceae bacterium]